MIVSYSFVDQRFPFCCLFGVSRASFRRPSLILLSTSYVFVTIGEYAPAVFYTLPVFDLI